MNHNLHKLTGALVSIVTVVLLLQCDRIDSSGNSTQTGNPQAMIFNPDCSPAAGVAVKIFKVDDTTRTPVSQVVTDPTGSYSFENIAQGTYNVYAEKNALVAFQDSVVVFTDTILIENDTLETASTLTAAVGLQPNHDPRTVTVQVVGTDIYSNVNEKGYCALTMLATGAYTLRLSTDLDGYTTTYRHVTITADSPDTIPDTLWLIYTGIPVVIDLKGEYDSITGIVHLHWAPTAYRDFLEYLVYRDTADPLQWSALPLYATPDTSFCDTLFSSLPNGNQYPLTAGQAIGLKYRVAIRNNSIEIGKTYQYVSISARSPAMIFKLVSPVDGEVIRDTNVVAIRWKPLENAGKYLLHISSAEAFTDTVMVAEQSDTLVKTPPLGKGEYFARIKVRNLSDEWSAWLSPFSFSVAGPVKPLPHQPVDTSFGSGTVAQRTINFAWSGVPFGVRYELQCAHKSDFAVLEKELTVSDSQVSFELPAGNFFWRCRSINSSGIAGEWSDTANFGIGVFKKFIGGPGNEYGIDVLQVDDGGYIVLGSTASPGSDKADIILVKLSPNGDIEWQKTFGGLKNESPGSMIKTTDNNLIIVGTSGSYLKDNQSDVVIIKTDINGNQLWSTSYHFRKMNCGTSIRETNDGGFIIGGSAAENIPTDILRQILEALVFKINSQGDTLWSRVYGEVRRKGGYASFVVPETDGGYIVGGGSTSLTNISSVTGSAAIYLMKIDENGDSIRLKSFGANLTDLNTFSKISTGGFFIGCVSVMDAMIYKFNESFEEEWSRVFQRLFYGGYENVIECKDNGFAFTGGGQSNTILTKISGNGDQQWLKEYRDDQYSSVTGHSIIRTADNGFLIVGDAYTTAGTYDIQIIKTDENGETTRK